MIADHAVSSCVYYPKEWGVSRFHLGQIVKYKGDLAFVSGLNYVFDQTHWVRFEDFAPGWYAEITFLTGKKAEFYETIGHHETCIDEITDYELGPLLGRSTNSIPSFVQNQLQRLGVACG